MSLGTCVPMSLLSSALLTGQKMTQKKPKMLKLTQLLLLLICQTGIGRSKYEVHKVYSIIMQYVFWQTWSPEYLCIKKNVHTVHSMHTIQYTLVSLENMETINFSWLWTAEFN